MLQHATKRYKHPVVFANGNKKSELAYEHVRLNFAFFTICMIHSMLCNFAGISFFIAKKKPQNESDLSF